ncbi:MAG: hypothetical protein GXP47_06635 [Acidobacteria bacterium]|nr:hypothetical protein [Acidobacteriota bacterium]
MRNVPMSIVIVTTIMWLVSSAGNAQEKSESFILPVVAHTTGAGNPPTRWVSDVVLHNLENTKITVGMAYFPFEHTNGWDGTFPVQLHLEARETRLVEDVLGNLFHETTNTKGMLLISAEQGSFPANPAHPELLLASRTYNTGSPAGTYGQTVPSNGLLANVSATPSYITGARNDGRFRSSLGIVNISLHPITVHYKILDASGKVLKESSVDLRTASGWQRLFTSLGIGKVTGPMTVELWLDPSDVASDPCGTEDASRFWAYVSKVDGNPDGTGDAEFLPAVDVPPADYSCDED